MHPPHQLPDVIRGELERWFDLDELRAVTRGVLGLDPERVARYWTDRKVRGGARPPVRVPSTVAVLRAVATKPGAVGYVRLSEVNNSVKVVAKVSGGRLTGP